jgi:hypothetical protein
MVEINDISTMNESDFNEHKIPPGGWQFYQPETTWRAPNPIANTLTQTTNNLVAMRKKNPAITAKFKLATNVEAAKAEVIKFNRKRLGLSEVAPVPFSEPHSQFGRVGVAVAVGDSIAGLKRAAQGTAVVIDWLRSGGAPVAQDLAEKRAKVCVACPQNQLGSWYTIAPAQLIKETLEARKDLKLATPFDDKLKSCNVCRCLMALKIWTPLEFILGKTKPEIMAEFPSNCWIAKRDA